METQNDRWTPILLIFIFIAIAGLAYLQDSSPTASTTAQEQAVTVLELSGPITSPRAELSGMGWHDDMLILLPQYPERFGDGDGALFALSKADILAALDGTRQTPLEPTLIPLVAPGMEDLLKFFRGYKSIAFYDDQVFLTAESQQGTKTHGFLVSGKIAPDSSQITLSTDKVAYIPITFPFAKRSDEAILIKGNSIFTFFEVNGSGLNPLPLAHVFDLNLNPQGIISFPSIEFRVTDAAADLGDNFWVINSFFPKDSDLATTNDPLSQKYGKGPTHAKYNEVERLVELTYSPQGITLKDTAPIQLTIDGNNSRNLEGLALLDDKGFLLVTNKYPASMLLFVKMPK